MKRLQPKPKSANRGASVAATPRRATPLDATERRAIYEALQELVRIYQFRDRDRACYGNVTPHECYALEAVERAGTLSVSGLGEALGLHKSNASRIADALEAKGYLRREADDADGRALRLRLSGAGKRTHDAIRARVEARQAEILAAYPPAVRRAFVELLGRLAGEATVRIGRGTGATSCS